MSGLPTDSGKQGPKNVASCATSPQTRRTISAALLSDFEALRNDVQQANELAFDFQRQLAGKANDFALLKQVFEKAREDMGRLQADITALREDRHRLANEAMKSEAYQMKLTSVTTERDRLRIDLEVIRKALASLQAEITHSNRERDKQIAELTVENTILKQALNEAQRRPAGSSQGSPAQPERVQTRDEEEQAVTFYT
jgi:chromosome segregation ATPase